MNSLARPPLHLAMRCAAADRPQQAVACASRPDALRRCGRRARRGHRPQGRTAARDRRAVLRLPVPQLHSPAYPVTRPCDQRGDTDQRARHEDLCAAVLCDEAVSAFDYPLSSRFDETDALITLDNVFVPWERVFIYRDVALCRDQWRKTPSRIYGNYQAQIRFATKLRFLLGVMKHHCEITGSTRFRQARLSSARWRRWRRSST